MGAARGVLLLALACGVLAGAGTAESPVDPSGRQIQSLSSTPAQGACLQQIQADVDFAMGCVLVGSVAFVMSLFYFLNSNDEDVQKYAWVIVSSAIALFSCVLVSTSWSGLIGYLYTRLTGSAPAQSVQTQLSLCSSLGWYLVLQVVLAYLSGAIGQPPASVREMWTECKCWGTLLSMITTGSCMMFWGHVQHDVRVAYPGRDLAIFLVIPICVICHLLLYWVCQRLRCMIARSDGGTIDKYERLWNDIVEDFEGNVLNMSVAFISIIFLRTAISGDMPQFNGLNPPGFRAGDNDCFELFLMALVFGCGMVIVDLAHLRFLGTALQLAKRRLKGALGNCIAFCLLWSINWSLGKTFGGGMLLVLLLALVVTLLGMFLVIVLDQLAELDCTSKTFDEEIHAFCPCIATLIGFSWKQAFSQSVVTLTQQTHYLDPAIETLILTACLVTVVYPAWRMYILPEILKPGMKELQTKYADDDDEQFRRISISIGGTAEDDIRLLQEGGEALLRTTSGLGAALLQCRSPSNGADARGVRFNRTAGVGVRATGEEVLRLRRRIEELEMTIIHIRGLVSTAGGVSPQK